MEQAIWKDSRNAVDLSSLVPREFLEEDTPLTINSKSEISGSGKIPPDVLNLCMDSFYIFAYARSREF